eukprot:5639035-Pyramimonas_sp.AAC.1
MPCISATLSVESSASLTRLALAASPDPRELHLAMLRPTSAPERRRATSIRPRANLHPHPRTATTAIPTATSSREARPTSLEALDAK